MLNVVACAGNLTRDPELRAIESGTSVLNATIAINRHFKKSDGEVKKEVVFVDIEAWGAIAEALAERGKKGDVVEVQGRLKQDRWEKEGEIRTKLKVSVDHFTVYELDRTRRNKNEDEDAE